MKKTLFIFYILNALLSFGQDEPVIVNATADRHVDKARRNALSPSIIDTIIPTAIVEYPLLSLKYETNAEVDKIHPASIKINDKLPQLYSTYVKVGVGSELMPLGEIYFNSKRSRKFVYGAHLKHLSSFGDIKDYSKAQFDRTRGLIYGGVRDKRYSVLGDIHYNNQGLHYFGISDTLNLHKDSISQRYSDFGIAGSYASHIKDSAKLNYKVGLAYNNFISKKNESDKLGRWRGQENAFSILTNAFYKKGKETYAADFNIKYNGFKYGILGGTSNGLDSGLILNNTVINLKPTITTFLFKNRFMANIGIDVVIDVHHQTKAYVFPIAEIKYSMFNDIFIPYAGIKGGLIQNSYKSLTQENEFIRPNIELRNEKTPIAFYAGIKGTLSKRVSFNADFNFGNVKDKALFITDTIQSLGNKFNVIYDTMNVAKIEGSISYQLKEKIKFDAIGRYYSYSALNNTYAWNLPQLQFVLRGSYNLYDKFIFNMDVNLEEGRRALANGSDIETTIENGQRISKLGFLADLNLGVEYRYSKRVSAFVEFNNLASQKYKRWYNTPVHAFQVMGGVTFRF